MKLQVFFPDGAIAPGMEAYAVLPAAKLYGHKWQQSRKLTDLCVKKVCIMQIDSIWNMSEKQVIHRIEITPLGYKESRSMDVVDCIYTSYYGILGINMFDTMEEAEAAAAVYRNTGISRVITNGTDIWFEDSKGRRIKPMHGETI